MFTNSSFPIRSSDRLFHVQRRLSRVRYHLSLLLLALAGISHGFAQQASGWKLIWSDEFDGALGTAPDPSKWKFQVGAGASIAGNDEAET